MNIESDHRALMIQLQKSGPASTRRPSRRSLENPFFLDQVFDDQRHCAALQAGDASKIRARERLARSDQVEDQVPVYLARRLIRCALPASKGKPRGMGIRHGQLPAQNQSSVTPNSVSQFGRCARLRSANFYKHFLDIFIDESLYHWSWVFCLDFELLPTHPSWCSHALQR